MTKFGYTLSSEEHDAPTLLRHAKDAEAAGFSFVSISDHFHPWATSQGHSPFVWSVIGAIAASTDSITVATGVTCPIQRYHPAIVAQAVATCSQLLGDRFLFGVGTGEALNEHVVDYHWPTPEVRREMLAEALEVIRKLWTGETVDHRGRFYNVENARLFDPPPSEPKVIVSGFGPEATQLAAQIGDGYWGNSPEEDAVRLYRDSGGTGPAIAQLSLCWASSTESARRTIHERWPNGGLSGQLSQDLPTWTHFEQAASVLTEEQVVGSLPAGPDLQPVLESVRLYASAGYDHLYFHQIGDDHEGFMKFWSDQLKPALDKEFK